MKQGHDSYYEEVPRYKNPYPVIVDNNHNNWNTGWDVASEEHRLFTENQTLKAEKEALEIEVDTLKGDNDYLREVAVRCKEDKETFVTAFGIAGDKIDSFRGSTVEISTLLDASFFYATDSTIFAFRREKMITYLRDLRAKVLALKKDFPEKIIKTIKKP